MILIHETFQKYKRVINFLETYYRIMREQLEICAPFM